MNTFLSYAWAPIYGLYLYVLFQILFLMRFGELNMSFSLLDLAIIFVGILSVVLLLYFMRKLTHKRLLMIIPFLIAIPFGYIGALGGGLLGAAGVLVFGLVPFAVLTPLGYAVIRWLTRPKSPSTTYENENGDVS